VCLCTRASLCKYFIQCMLLFMLIHCFLFSYARDCLIHVFYGLVELGTVNRVYVLAIIYIFIGTWVFYIVILYGAALLCSPPVPQSPRFLELDSWMVIAENSGVQGLSFQLSARSPLPAGFAILRALQCVPWKLTVEHNTKIKAIYSDLSARFQAKGKTF